jgi:hypothetical protein
MVRLTSEQRELKKKYRKLAKSGERNWSLNYSSSEVNLTILFHLFLFFRV